MKKADLKKVPDTQEIKETVKEIEDTVSSKTETEKEYTIEVIRDFYGEVDVTYMSKLDPNYAYRFLRDEFKNLSLKTTNLLFAKGGWQVCPKSHLLKLGLKEKELSPDGFYRRGDMILAFMPKELFEQKNDSKKKKANAPMEQINRLLNKGNPDIGGKEIHESMSGIQTQKDLGM